MKLRGIIMLLLCWFCLSACGKAGTDLEMGIGGSLYPAQPLSGEGEESKWSRMKVQGETLYFIDSNNLYSLPLEEDMNLAVRKTLAGGGSSSLKDYALGPDEALYYVIGHSRMGADWTFEPAGCTVIRQKGAESKGWKLDLAEENIPWAVEACLATDRDGRLFLLAEDGISLFGGDGKQIGSLDTENYRFSGGSERLLKGSEGRLYYAVCRSSSIYGEQIVYEILGGDSPRLEKVSEISGRLYDSEYGLLCGGEDGILYRYQAESAEWEPVLRWTDSGIDSPEELAQISEEQFMVLCSVAKGGYMKGSVSLLTRKDVSELPEKKVLTLAAIYPSQKLTHYVSKFNQENEEYQIVIEHYEWEDVATRLNSRLVSSEPPDLVDIGGLDAVNYANRKVFEDLTPYLESSSILDRENYFEKILEAYTIGGRLVCIPANFYIDVVLGRASQVGDEMGWTMEEVMRLWEKFPDKKLMRYDKAEYLLKELYGKYICSRFMDQETGECSFDSAEFREFMEWLKYYEDKNAMNSGSTEWYWTEDSLLYIENLNYLSQYAADQWLAGEKITAIGRPTADKSPSIAAQVQDALCISSRSRHKEGAWAFLEYFLSQEQEGFGFSSREDVFMQRLEEEMTPDYWRTEDGEIIQHEQGIDRDGNILPPGPWIRTRAFVWDPVTQKSHELYDYMSREQADELLEIFSVLDFTPKGGIEETVMEIILEEVAGYLSGERTVDDTAGNIQNRVRNLLQENR